MALASAQHQVVTARQLRDLGFDKKRVARLVRKGWLVRCHRAVYSVGTDDLYRMGEILAAVLACGQGAGASHQSAAHLHEVRQHRWGPVHVTVPTTGARSRPGIQVHAAAAFTSAVVHGIPCTDIRRTLTDLADVLGPTALRQAVGTAERKGLIDRATYVPLPGRRRVMDAPHVFTRSQNEAAMYALCEAFRIPLPLVNQLFDDTWEVDFYWPEYGLVVELDAWFTHGNPATFEMERLKDEHLELRRGLMVRRVTDTRLHERPAEVAAVIRLALDARGPL